MKWLLKNDFCDNIFRLNSLLISTQFLKNPTEPQYFCRKLIILYFQNMDYNNIGMNKQIRLAIVFSVGALIVGAKSFTN